MTNAFVHHLNFIFRYSEQLFEENSVMVMSLFVCLRQYLNLTTNSTSVMIIYHGAHVLKSGSGAPTNKRRFFSNY